ncbi:MAG: hypothetical protein FJ144_26260 [Deltaproteobacteria bacterium]|nr:hypothetical protein [Deltaproteobacteria bacterium]
MSSITPRRLSELIHALYAAAENSDLWSGFLEALADKVESHMTVLVAIARDDETGSASAAVRVDPEAVRLYNESWGEQDVVDQFRS